MVEITISSLPSSILESMLNVVGKRIKKVATEHFFSVIAAYFSLCPFSSLITVRSRTLF